MRYIRAEDVLPEELILRIQQYADGVTLYIPRKAENRRGWGCGTEYRRELAKRNAAIRKESCGFPAGPMHNEKNLPPWGKVPSNARRMRGQNAAVFRKIYGELLL